MLTSFAMYLCVCVLVFAYLCLYILMNSPCIGLELYGKLYKTQMKLFWANSENSGFTSEIYSHERCKMELLFFFFPFFLTSCIGNTGFNCQWRLEHGMKNECIGCCAICITKKQKKSGLERGCAGMD